MPIEPTSPFVFAKPAPSEQESAPALIATMLVAAGLAVGGSVFAFAAEKQEGSRGSYVGTTPGAPTPSSKTDRLAAASGIDPTKSTTGSGRDGC